MGGGQGVCYHLSLLRRAERLSFLSLARKRRKRRSQSKAWLCLLFKKPNNAKALLRAAHAFAELSAGHSHVLGCFLHSIVLARAVLLLTLHFGFIAFFLNCGFGDG